MTPAEFRKAVKQRWPHITISVRTVDFTDLLRRKAKCLDIRGDKAIEEVLEINALAKQAGIVPDGSARFYGNA